VRSRLVTAADRPALRRRIQRLHQVAWPPFLRDGAVNALWPRLYTDFPAFQFVLMDRRGRLVAAGNSVPFAWDGRPRSLPRSIVQVLRRAIDDRVRGRRPTVLSALAAIVDPRQRGVGWSAEVLLAMRRLAARHGLPALVAPVRPSAKGRYPLTPLSRYATWTRPDGSVFDPWLRVHFKLGARILSVAPRSNTVRATVGEWEAWTGLALPESGRYVVPGAFQPIRVDRRRDRVHYHEANVWMLHCVPTRSRASASPTASPRSSRI
jgi:hypothetical protein